MGNFLKTGYLTSSVWRPPQPFNLQPKYSRTSVWNRVWQHGYSLPAVSDELPAVLYDGYWEENRSSPALPNSKRLEAPLIRLGTVSRHCEHAREPVRECECCHPVYYSNETMVYKQHNQYIIKADL